MTRLQPSASREWKALRPLRRLQVRTFLVFPSLFVCLSACLSVTVHYTYVCMLYIYMYVFVTLSVSDTTLDRFIGLDKQSTARAVIRSNSQLKLRLLLLSFSLSLYLSFSLSLFLTTITLHTRTRTHTHTHSVLFLFFFLYLCLCVRDDRIMVQARCPLTPLNSCSLKQYWCCLAFVTAGVG